MKIYKIVLTNRQFIDKSIDKRGEGEDDDDRKINDKDYGTNKTYKRNNKSM